MIEMEGYKATTIISRGNERVQILADTVAKKGRFGGRDWNGYSRVGFFNIYILFIIYYIKILDIFKLSNELDISISIYYLSYNEKNKIVNISIQSLYIHTHTKW